MTFNVKRPGSEAPGAENFELLERRENKQEGPATQAHHSRATFGTGYIRRQRRQDVARGDAVATAMECVTARLIEAAAKRHSRARS